MTSTAVPPPSAGPPPPAPAKISFPSRIYNGLIGAVDPVVPNKLRPLWNHPAGKFTLPSKLNDIESSFFLGPKTIFFWSPLFKWVSKILYNHN